MITLVDGIAGCGVVILLIIAIPVIIGLALIGLNALLAGQWLTAILAGLGAVGLFWFLLWGTSRTTCMSAGSGGSRKRREE